MTRAYENAQCGRCGLWLDRLAQLMVPYRQQLVLVDVEEAIA